MNIFNIADIAAIIVFALAWAFYHFAIERTGRSGLNRRMDEYRMRWMLEMARRETRMTDSAIMASLQNGAAFFASASLLAIGAVATLLRAGDDAMKIAADLPLGFLTTRMQWEFKVIGLLVICGYAFFKFSWSYRLFNYAAILMGATPEAKSPDAGQRERIARRAGNMNIAAAHHFNRGQRAIFFALAYLGWFLGPWIFMATTIFVCIVMWARQFRSEARDALIFDVDDTMDMKR
jgi:uncharacterized membrane protein